MGLPKKQCFDFPSQIFNQNYFEILSYFEIGITLPKIIQTFQGGGVLETSGPPLDDGHIDL